MNDIITRYNLSNNIVYIIQIFLSDKMQYQKVMDEINLGAHTIRFVHPVPSENRIYDIYVPNTKIFKEIRLSDYYCGNMYPSPLLSKSKPLYVCRFCKNKIEVRCGDGIP